jgi:hypothetical protein
MDCHEKIQARRRKRTTKNAVQRQKPPPNNGVKLDKSLPAIPPSTSANSAFASELETPPIEVYSELPAGTVPRAGPTADTSNQTTKRREQSPAIAQNDVQGKHNPIATSVHLLADTNLTQILLPYRLISSKIIAIQLYLKSPITLVLRNFLFLWHSIPRRLRHSLPSCRVRGRTALPLADRGITLAQNRARRRVRNPSPKGRHHSHQLLISPSKRLDDNCSQPITSSSRAEPGMMVLAADQDRPQCHHMLG